MLKALGLFDSEEAATELMAKMPCLPLGSYKAVAAAPLSEAGFTMDMVVLEEGPERIMWLSLASIYFKSGRHSWSSSVFQASCVDVTVVPYVTGKPNACFRLLRLQGCHRPRRRRGTDRDILHPAGRDHKGAEGALIEGYTADPIKGHISPALERPERSVGWLTGILEVEVREADPFGSNCCDLGARRMTAGEAERFIAEVKERDRLVKQIVEEYEDSIKLKRELVTSRKYDYPDHVLDLRNMGVPLPYVFVNGTPVYTERFPTY